jgi:hypothetical protein
MNKYTTWADYFNKIQNVLESKNTCIEGQFHSIQHKGSSLNGEHSLTELRVICAITGEWGSCLQSLCVIPLSEPTTKDQNNCTKMGDYGDYERLKP